jgi:hypothetical protein
LGLLTWELNQSNSLARFNAHSDINHLYGQLNQLQIGSTEVAQLWAQLRDETSELSEVDVERAIGLAYWHRNIWTTSEQAFREGWIEQDKFQMSLNDIENVSRNWPGMKPYLRTAVQSLADGRELMEVEELIMQITVARLGPQ